MQAAVLKQYRCVFAMFELTRCVFAMLGPLCLKLPPEPNNCQKTKNLCAAAALPPRGACVVPRCRAYHETHLQIESTRLVKFSDVLLFVLSLLNSPCGVLRLIHQASLLLSKLCPRLSGHSHLRGLFQCRSESTQCPGRFQRLCLLLLSTNQIY